MTKLKTQKKPRLSLIRSEEGATTVEYIIMLVLIAIVGFYAWKSFGEKVKHKVDDANVVMDDLQAEGVAAEDE